MVVVLSDTIENRIKENSARIKTQKLILGKDDYGLYLGRGEGNLQIKKNGNVIEEYPLYEANIIKEAFLKDGNYVPVRALMNSPL